MTSLGKCRLFSDTAFNPDQPRSLLTSSPTMGDGSMSRKRKHDQEAAQANDFLRQALGTRRQPAPCAHLSTSLPNTLPAAGLPKRQVPDYSHLRSVVDGRVNDWKQQQSVSKKSSAGKKPAAKGRSIPEPRRKLSAAASSRTRNMAPKESRAQGEHRGGFFQEVAARRPTRAPVKAAPDMRVKSREHSIQATSRVVADHIPRTKIRSMPAQAADRVNGNCLRKLQDRRPQDEPESEKQDVRASIEGRGADIVVTRDDDDSSSEDGIIEVVNTRKRRRLSPRASGSECPSTEAGLR